jgi:hypothetical protein
MSPSELIALAGFAVAAVTMLLVTQTKERVSWPSWLVPAVVVVPFAVWTALAIAKEGFFGFWPMLTGSHWGLQVWFDRLMSVTAAFYLLQNRARAAGMKSEVWVLVVIFTGSIGLFLMLARTLNLERKTTV